MFTSQEIRKIEFEEVKRGYNTTDVRAFLRKISEQVAEMEQQQDGLGTERQAFAAEKAGMEEKMQLLADKIEQYRSEEDSIRAALLSAQKLGDSIIKEANENAAIILNDARKRADEQIHEAEEKIASEKGTLERLQNEVTKFKNEVLSIYKSHLEVLSLLPESENAGSKSEPEAPAFIPEEPVPVISVERETIVFESVSVGEEPEIPAETSAAPSWQPEARAEDAPPSPPVSEPEPFFAPESSEPEGEVFNAFDSGYYAEPAAEETAENTDAGMPEADQKAPSRFGQLDFGDGFSFTAK